MDVHFILYVADQARSESFYRSALGVEPRLSVPGMTEFEIADHAVLGLMPSMGIRALLGPALPDPERAAGIPRAELYLRVPDALTCHRRALEAGGVELSPLEERDWGDRAAYCRDPDGHVLAFGESMAGR